MKANISGALASLILLTLGACAGADAPSQSEDRSSAGAPIQAEWSPAALADLQRAAEAAPLEGLAAPHAALTRLAARGRGAETDPARAQARDAVADALFDQLAEDFASGAAAPAAADPGWLLPRAAGPDGPALHAALARGVAPSALLQSLLPQSDAYRALRAELAKVQAEAPDASDAQGRGRAARIEALRANIERWRWLPRTLAPLRVEVRIPQFEAALVRPGREELTHAAIVGTPRTPTPRFAAEIVGLTLNPSWTPPASIVRELLPRFRRDPEAATREGFEALDSSGHIVPPDGVDWRARPFPYQLRQRPGPANALGVMRFDLPNPYAVYLHDTPSRTLFDSAERAFSHGCVRLADPVSFAAALLDTPNWDEAALEDTIAAGVTRTIALDAPIPILFLYFTAAPGADGAIAYARDLYGLDARIVRTLDAADAPQPAVAIALRASGQCRA